jgi:FkbH-like protein
MQSVSVDPFFAAPNVFTVTPTPLRRAVVVSQCLLEPLIHIVSSATETCKVDHFVINHAGQLPERPAADPAEYDFQIVQLPLRTILWDADLLKIGYESEEDAKAQLDQSIGKMRMLFDLYTAWGRNFSIPTFVCNLLTPMASAHGRLLPRYDLRNPLHFVERLNQELAALVEAMPGAYLLDIDTLSASIGRRYIQDDSLTITSHGSLINDWDTLYDGNRLEAAGSPEKVFGTQREAFLLSVWREAVSMHRTLRQIDQIKMVVVDLDDTLWRGVIAESGEVDHTQIDGWPIGVTEALQVLKRRGVILAILSKNDPARVEQFWDSLFAHRLRMSDFAIRKISWSPKAMAMEEILSEASLLPKSVLYIDDNPVERAQVQGAFPDMRVMGGSPYTWRRALLWAPETQVTSINSEAARRTEMVQAQVERKVAQTTQTREEFLAGLDLIIELSRLPGEGAPGFDRALELINKTNQFNTTGERWTRAELATAISSGSEVYTFNVRDRFTNYGLVGVIVMQGALIRQMVMSCRVLGLDVEKAAVATLLNRILSSGVGEIRARLIETDANGPCGGLWPNLGFTQNGEVFAYAGGPVAIPDHANVKLDLGVIETAAPVAEVAKAAPATQSGLPSLPSSKRSSGFSFLRPRR